ncbi:NAD(P)H-hydrate dehydratase [Brachybacterium sp. P6-10-X1]|uniref:NAD(P)H-hydrate dehydratase n=1 Tax=Brachybacterium sp. P6-10-X1 TaxID=1903186 RepID=UPI000971B13D|nr:NAD(P)H-hydrate dehydratase [Brachybacterium sp. P6-10-X1]APX32676.1 NAD(P)H-hydrate dehydratase [Brachybacterium sp. P6-10-X1]
MIRGYTAQQVRAAERPLLDAGRPLMLHAARALAGRVAEHLRAPDAPRVLVLAGSGDNGGDGLYAAALLRGQGIVADAIATADGFHAGGAEAFREAGGTLHALDDADPEDLRARLAEADLVLDAIVGIGGRAEVPAYLTTLLEEVRRSGAPVIAVDVPSFVDASTGLAAPGALTARETVTFGAVKAGLLLPGGAELAGHVHLVDLDLADHLPAEPTVIRLGDAEVTERWPQPERDATKYSRGVVALVAGSPRFPGAAVLAASGAARTGAGMVRVIAPQSVLDLVLRTRPEVVGHPAETVDPEAIGRLHALVAGPGLASDDPRTRAGVDLLSTAGGENTPGEVSRGVIDAGGLDAIGAAHRFPGDVVLTPHRGEADRLAERLGIDPDLPGPDLAIALATATGATVLLKGAITLIAPADGGPLCAQDDATSQLATAGTGDVLAGMIGTLLAAGLTGPDAATLAAILHGRAGRLASRGGTLPLVALDVAEHLPEALGTILAGALS